MWDNRKSNIDIIGLSEGEAEKKNNLEDMEIIMAENFCRIRGKSTELGDHQAGYVLENLVLAIS